MRLVRFRDGDGLIRTAHEDADGRAWLIDGDPFGSFRVTGSSVTVGERLSPVVPTQIMGIGLNYRRHAQETGAKIPAYPIVFFKNVMAATGSGQPIFIPRHLPSAEVDYEGELAVVIGKPCRNVSRERALEHVLGYTCANDVSARDWQIGRGGSQWSRGKSFDTFAPLGPALVTTDELTNPNALALSTTLNGERVQESSTADMIFDVPQLIEFLSGSTLLAPGTVILTGTPAGVGMARKPPVWLKAGDEVAVTIEGIGTLINRVAVEP